MVLDSGERSVQTQQREKRLDTTVVDTGSHSLSGTAKGRSRGAEAKGAGRVGGSSSGGNDGHSDSWEVVVEKAAAAHSLDSGRSLYLSPTERRTAVIHLFFEILDGRFLLLLP